MFSSSVLPCPLCLSPMPAPTHSWGWFNRPSLTVYTPSRNSATTIRSVIPREHGSPRPDLFMYSLPVNQDGDRARSAKGRWQARVWGAEAVATWLRCTAQRARGLGLWGYQLHARSRYKSMDMARSNLLALPAGHNGGQLGEDLSLSLVRAPRVGDRVGDDCLPSRLVKVEVVLYGDVICTHEWRAANPS